MIINQDSVEHAFCLLQKRKPDIARYCSIMQQSSMVNVAIERDFQKSFTAFYRVRRDIQWRDYYFQLFEEMKEHAPDISFEEILIRLFQFSGQIEASFSSKMLATIDPNKPIWDSMVLSNLGLKLKGSNKEKRLADAIILYDEICAWYRDFMKTNEAIEVAEKFDLSFPEFCHITTIKKIDFVIWALR